MMPGEILYKSEILYKTKQLILKLLRVNVNRLSHETQAEVCRVAGLEKCEGNIEENIEAPFEMREIDGTQSSSNLLKM